MSEAWLVDAAAFEALLIGGDLDAVGKDDRTPLHHAVAAGRQDLVRRLLDAGASANARGKTRPGSGRRALTDGGPALLLAVDAGDLEMVELLLSGKGKQRARATTGNGCGLTPAHVAAGRGHREILRRLIEAKARPEAKVKAFEGHLSLEADARPLHAAAMHGTPETVAVLLDAGVEIDPVDTAGETPLVAAARAGRLPTLRALIAAGADPGGKRAPALFAAAESGTGETMRALIASGAIHQGRAGLSVIHAAATNPEPSAVAVALEAEDATEADRFGLTPLHRCALGGSPEVAQRLLDAGADPDARLPRDAKVEPLVARLLGWLHYRRKLTLPLGATPAQCAEMARVPSSHGYATHREVQAWNARCRAVEALLRSRCE